MAVLLNVHRSARSCDMRGGMVSTPGLARSTETPRHRQGRTSACPCELGVDRSPVLIEPIVASEGSGGRLGNYADPAAARSACRCPLLWATIPTDIMTNAAPRCQPRSIWTGRASRAAHILQAPSGTCGAGDGDHDIGRADWFASAGSSAHQRAD